MTKPTIGQSNWGQALNDHLDTLQAKTGLEADVSAKLGTGGALDTALNSSIDARAVPKWRASTAYTAGDTVLAPDGTPVKAKVTFTSGATYNAANWTSVATSAGTQAQAELAAAYMGAKVVTGTGIDTTAATDSLAAMQAKLDSFSDGDFAVIPAGAYKLTGKLTITKRLTLFVLGELRFTAGITNGVALGVEADGAKVHFAKITNPNSLGSQTGGASFGVEVKANHVTVSACHIDGFQNGIAVSAYGEFVGFDIEHNRVTNVKGAGDGASNTTSTYGEDRGDGIVSWGAQGRIANNFVEAAPGTDARIGIHVENLGTYATVHPAHEAEMVTITGNVVSGKFRRSIVNEGVAGVAITGNTVADATWWGIALVTSTEGCSVSGNTIIWTRQSSDQQGQAWSPDRAPLMLYGPVKGANVTDNTIILAGIAGALIYCKGASGAASECRIAGNVTTVRSGSATDGLAAIGTSAPTGLTLEGNRFAGFNTHGMYLAGASDLIIEGNRLAGSSAGYGIRGAITDSRIQGNKITGCTTKLASIDSTVSTDIPVWQSVTLQNSWTDPGYAGHPAPGFWRAADGRVYIRGNVTGGALGAAAFTLPTGCRPDSTLIMRGQGAGAVSLRVDVNSDGTVVPTNEGTYSAYLSLNGLSFATA